MLCFAECGSFSFCLSSFVGELFDEFVGGFGCVAAWEEEVSSVASADFDDVADDAEAFDRFEEEEAMELCHGRCPFCPVLGVKVKEPVVFA